MSGEIKINVRLVTCCWRGCHASCSPRQMPEDWRWLYVTPEMIDPHSVSDHFFEGGEWGCAGSALSRALGRIAIAVEGVRRR
jgi:hypothetical protein